MILFGAKVSRAFGVATTPFAQHIIDPDVTLTVMPHPSGRCRVWQNEIGSERLARDYIMQQCAALREPN